MDVNLPDKVKENIDQFTGRAWLAERILDWYDHKLDRLLLIAGKPGTGKSMVSAWLTGSGPLPENPASRGQLERIRSLMKGAHFCRAGSLDNSPKEMADHLARQLAERMPGFDAALTSLGGGRIEVTANQQIGRVAEGANVTGIKIEKLDLGGLFDEPSFDLALAKPLKKVFEAGGEAGLLLIDALDEAAAYEGKFKILQAVLKLLDLNVPLRVIATLRDEPDVLQYFRGYPVIDLVEDSPAGQDDVRLYVTGRLKGQGDGAMQQVADQVIKNANGIFLFAHLVTEDLLGRLRMGELPAVEDVPAMLADYYHQNLLRLLNGDMKIWRKSLRPLLGTVAVSQDPGLRRPVLAKITRRDREELLDDLRVCKAYLDGALDDGPFRLFHKSLSDFLLEDEDNQDFQIDAAGAHSQVVYYYWPKSKSQVDWSNWDAYGWRSIATHLAGASRSEEADQCHGMARRLVDLIASPQHQRAYVEKVGDLGQYERDLTLAVRSACLDPLEEGLPLVVRSVDKLLAFRETQLRPRRVFHLAARGDLDSSLSHLTLFPAEEHWVAAAELLIAWMAAEAGDARAALLHEQVKQNYRAVPPLPLLADRAAMAWGGAAPVLEPLPAAPPREILEAVVYNVRSEKIQAGLLVSYLGEAQAHVFEQVYEGLNEPKGADRIPAKRAQVDGPVLVSYAVQNCQSSDGLQAFLRYLNVMAANQYRTYRNRSLWELMDAALRHPDQRWTRAALARVISAALSPKGAEFTEAFPLVLLALKARLGSAEDRKTLDQRYEQALQKVSKLGEERGRNDVTGAHKRRFSALALAYNLLPDGSQRAKDLVEQANSLPRGYAGFLAPAWLELAETSRIVGGSQGFEQVILEKATNAAHYISDPAFCARTTARVNGLRRHWWPFPAGRDLAGTVQDFASRPFSPEYSAVHIVGERYEPRGQDPDPAMKLPDMLLLADSPAAVAEAMDFSVRRLLDLNRDRSWEAGTILKLGEEVRLPSTSFAPIMAVRLATEVVVSALSRDEKRRLIQLLVPVALPDRTALDAVLARLFYAARPDDLAVLGACQLAQAELKPGGSTTETTTGWFSDTTEQPAMGEDPPVSGIRIDKI